MLQQDDNLYDWIRQSLASYRPDYNPTDWQQIQRRLRRRRRLRRFALVIGGLVLLGLLSWLVPYPDNAARRVSRTSPRQSPVIIAPADTPSEALPAPLAVAKKPTNTAPLRIVNRSTPAIAHASFPVPVPVQPRTLVTPLPVSLPPLTEWSSRLRMSVEETAIIRQMQTGAFGTDSTSYRAVARNLVRWPKAVIVCDLTTSMYPYTTQLVTWLKKQTTPSTLQGMVFFTDCDSLGQQTRPGGPPGQMFVTRGQDATAILPTLLSAARNTIQNNDDAENDVEALLYAQRAFPQASHLILIADNLSRVKDIRLLPKLDKPVHVVLCGTTGGDPTVAFQPEFAQIAYQSHGSLHTLEDDLNPRVIPTGETLRVGPYYYRYNARRRQFVLTLFHHRPRRFLGIFWF